MSTMNQRFVIPFLLAAGTVGCGSPGANGTDDERVLSLESGADCAEPGDVPSITTVTGPLASSLPRFVVPGDDGVWFTDSQDVTLSRLSQDGTLLRLAAPFPSADVFDAALGADDSVWFGIVTGDLVAHLGRMTPDGTTTLFVVPSGQRAHRLASGPDGTIWFTAGENVGRVTAAGTIEEFAVGERAGDLTPGADGAIWFTEPDVNRIGRVASDGTVVHFDVPSPNSGPHSMALGADGNVWFTQANTGKVGRIDNVGVIHEFAVVAPPQSPRELATGPDGRLWFTLATGEPGDARIGSLSTCGTVTIVELPDVQNSVDFRPAVAVPAVPYGIAGGDDEVWVTARLDPFETGAVLRVDLRDAMR